MPVLPAICDTCGTTFPSGINIEGAHATFEGNRAGPCPNCGGMGTIPTGGTDTHGQLYFLRQAYDVLAAPGVTREDLEQLYERIEHAIAEQATPAQVAETISQEAPRFSLLTEMLSAKGVAVATWLTLLLTLIGVLLAARPSDDPDVVINQTITIYDQSRSPSATAQPTSTPPTTTPSPTTQPRPTMTKQPYVRPSPKIGRNEPCPCGSGRKFKKCHGALENTSGVPGTQLKL